MIQRCYDPKYQERQPSYKGCTVCTEWHSFEVFYRWWLTNYVEGWQLDKDLLVVGNKVYSPATCVYLPPELNGLLLGRAVLGRYGLGVSSYKEKNSGITRYTSSFAQQGKHVYLGVFNTSDEATKAYSKAKRDYTKTVLTRYYKEGLLPVELCKSIMEQM